MSKKYWDVYLYDSFVRIAYKIRNIPSLGRSRSMTNIRID